MPEDEDFFVNYKGTRLKVSPVTNKGNIYFIVHFAPPIIIAEGMVNEEWVWYESGKGETNLAAELGDIIEKSDI